MENLLRKDDSFFVAGHKGMVGSAIVRDLKKNGYCDKKKGGELYIKNRSELDLTCSNDVNEWFKKYRPKIVIIAAAKVGGIYANYKYPYDFISENLKIEQNIIEASCFNGTRRLLFLGSSCIYPKFPNLPIKEEDLLSSYLEKTNESYAIAKIAGIKLCEAIRRQKDFDAISLMPTNLYGPGDNYSSDNSHVMASLLKKFIMAKRNGTKEVTCWGTGKPLREFLHVDDLGKACVHALEKWNPNDKHSPIDKYGEKLLYLNVGSGQEISIKSLAKKIAKLINFEGKIIWDKNKPDGTFRKKLDISRFKSMGWEPKINLDKGISMEIKNIEEALNNRSDKGKSLKNFF